MALSKTVTKSFFGKEVSYEDAYIKVGQIHGDKEELIASIEVRVSADGDIIETRSIIFPLDLNGENPIKQAYVHMKTLAAYAEAKDV